MYLIYVDDYGNTGARLDDPQQPLFLLSAVLVPEAGWKSLEAEIWGVISEVCTRSGAEPDDFEIHAVDFFSGRNKRMNGIPLVDRIAYAERLAEKLIEIGGSLIVAWVRKDMIVEFRSKMEKDFGEEEAKHMSTPYVMAFGTLIHKINQFLERENDRGIVIIDQQQEFEHARLLKSHRIIRQDFQSGNFGLLDLPLEGRSQHNLLLQTADLFGYFMGKFIRSWQFDSYLSEEYAKTLLSFGALADVVDVAESMADIDTEGNYAYIYRQEWIRHKLNQSVPSTLWSQAMMGIFKKKGQGEP